LDPRKVLMAPSVTVRDPVWIRPAMSSVTLDMDREGVNAPVTGSYRYVGRRRFTSRFCTLLVLLIVLSLQNIV
jgi:hypothetical protein